MSGALRKRAKSLRQQALVVYHVARDPRTPWFTRVLALAVAAYALSPIDLIPDFIPVLGYLDDVVIVPLGIMAAVKLVPAELMEEFRSRAATSAQRPTSYAGAILIASLWIAAGAALAAWWWFR